jgi:protein TonB
VITVATPPAPPTPKAGPSAVRRFAARFSGSAVSLLVHGGFVLLAFLSVAAPRTGRGGGIVGSSELGSGAHDYSAIVQRESTIDAEKSPDARLFPQAEPETPETPEAVVPPVDDFIRDQPAGETLPVAKLPPVEESRPKRTYEKLPPTGGSETADAPEKNGGDQKGNSTVNGTGGDTGGAGDGTAGALFMPSPDYPASARRRGIEGVVVISVFVHPDGHCDGAEIVEGSGCTALDDSALSTIKKWRYEAHSGGPELRRVRFVFKLR